MLGGKLEHRGGVAGDGGGRQTAGWQLDDKRGAAWESEVAPADGAPRVTLELAHR